MASFASPCLRRGGFRLFALPVVGESGLHRTRSLQRGLGCSASSQGALAPQKTSRRVYSLGRRVSQNVEPATIDLHLTKAG